MYKSYYIFFIQIMRLCNINYQIMTFSFVKLKIKHENLKKYC